VGAISTGLTARFTEPGERPQAARERWKKERPAWLPDHYRELEELASYNSITWEWRHTQASMKLVLFSRFFGGQTVYRITALFEDDGRFGSIITVNGLADPKTRTAIQEAAEGYYAGGVV